MNKKMLLASLLNVVFATQTATTAQEHQLLGLADGPFKSAKSPILQVVGKGIFLDEEGKSENPWMGTAFVVMHNNQPHIITAAHLPQYSRLSDNLYENFLFVKTFDSDELFPVLPKKLGAVGDACALALHNPKDMKKILGSTQALELADSFSFGHAATYLKDRNSGPRLNNQKLPVTMIGCNVFGEKSSIETINGNWIGLQDTMVSFQRPALVIDKEVFGGMSGGPVLVNNKVVGIISIGYEVKIGLDGELQSKQVNKTYAAALPDILEALHVFNHNDKSPFSADKENGTDAETKQIWQGLKPEFTLGMKDDDKGGKTNSEIDLKARNKLAKGISTDFNAWIGKNMDPEAQEQNIQYLFQPQQYLKMSLEGIKLLAHPLARFARLRKGIKLDFDPQLLKECLKEMLQQHSEDGNKQQEPLIGKPVEGVRVISKKSAFAKAPA